VLVSLVPLTLLGLAFLGALGVEDVWRSEIGPAVAERVRPAVFAGIDDTVEQVFARSALPLIAFASLLALWHVARGMRLVMKALNAIHGVKEARDVKRLLLTDLALSVALIAVVACSFLLVTVLPRAVDGGLASVGLRIGAWLAAGVLLGGVIGVLVRYAPAERPEVRWASAGSLAIVVAWVVATAGFAWWAGSVANYKSAAGVLLAFLVLTTYVLVSTSIFLVGVQLDELARKARS
jgi:membrane protein